MSAVSPAPTHRLFISHLWIIAGFELTRLFSTRRGLLYLITFAVIWYFILFYPISMAAGAVQNSEHNEQGLAFFDMLGLSSLLLWKVPEFAVYWRFALYLFPLLCIFLTADQTSSDREKGTLRFLTLRCSRDSIFFGRFAGLMLIQGILIITSLLSTMALVLWRDLSLFGAALNSVLAISVNLIFILLPFTAMMALLSAAVRSARQATVWAILTWTLLAALLKGVATLLPSLFFLQYLVPGMQLPALAQIPEWQTLQLAYIPLMQTALLLLAGRRVMAWRAL